MQIAVLNDTHFGARNDNQQFLDYFFRFFDDVFFPYCEEHNIKTVIHLGDIMDRRKYVNFNTLNQVRTRFVQKLAEWYGHALYPRQPRHLLQEHQLDQLLE